MSHNLRRPALPTIVNFSRDEELPSARPGTVLANKYIVERELGRGGMGIVVAARHQELDEPCAIKLLRIDEEEYRDEMLARFRREARISAKVRSEHVLRVYDAGKLPEGTPYMVMELLEGEDLATVLYHRGALPHGDAVAWMLQACEGLAAIHAAGVVHRDLKPENLFLEQRPDGSMRLKILDLGIAKVASRHSIPDDARLTLQAGAMGTPPYLAPEQITTPEDADARADVWAIGTVLYALLTGKDAFASSSQHDSMLHILTAKHTPVRTHRAEIPAHLESVVERCLCKEPSARFQSVAEVAQALAENGSDEDMASARRCARILGLEDGAVPRFSTPALERRGRATLTPLTSQHGGSGALSVPERASQDRRRLISFAAIACAALVAVLGGLAVWRSPEPPLPTQAGAPGIEAAVMAAPPPPSAEKRAEPEASASAPSASPTSVPAAKSAAPVVVQPPPAIEKPKKPVGPVSPLPPPAKEDLFDDRK